MSKKSKYRRLRFPDQDAFNLWLSEKARKIIHLKDVGQDMHKIWIDEEGEILHTDFHSHKMNGKFINLDVLEVDSILVARESGKDQWDAYWRLMPEKIEDLPVPSETEVVS